MLDNGFSGERDTDLQESDIDLQIHRFSRERETDFQGRETDSQGKL